MTKLKNRPIQEKFTHYTILEMLPYLLLKTDFRSAPFFFEMCYHVISSKIVNVRAEIRNGPICSRNITGKKIPTQNILVTKLSTNQEMI